MGTTIVGHLRRRSTASTSPTWATAACYRVRDGKLEQLTEDHSLLNDYIKMKRLTAEEIANFPHKNVIVRALGMKDTVKVDTRFEVPRANDVVPALLRRPLGPGRATTQILQIIDSATDLKLAPRSARSSAPTRTAGPTTSPACSPAGSLDGTHLPDRLRERGTGPLRRSARFAHPSVDCGSGALGPLRRLRNSPAG